MGKNPARPVLHLIDSLDCGGAQQLLVELAKATPQAAYPTYVAVIQPFTGLAGRLEALGIPVYKLNRPRAGILSPVAFLRYLTGTLRDVMRLCRAHKVSVLHCHLSDAEFIGIPAGKLAGVARILTTVHTPLLLPSRPRLDPRNWLRQRFTPLILNLADWIIAVSDETGATLERMGVRKEKLCVIENGVAIEECPETTGASLRAALGIAPDAPLLTAVARLTEAKGLIHLVRAMPRILARYPKARLLIVGEGELRASLCEEIQTLGVTEAVSLPGMRSDIRTILCLTDVFVTASLWEGTSLALLEAMGASRPIVATDIEGNRTILRHEANCLLAAPADPDALADRILRLLEDRPLAQALGRQAYQDMSARYSIDRMFAQYESLWNTSSGCQAAGQGCAAKAEGLRVAVMGLRGIPATWGGVERQCEQLYSRLVAMGFSVTVYARLGYVTPPIDAYKGMRIVCLPTVPNKYLETLVHTFLAVLHAGFSRYDIWHIYSQGAFLWSPLAKLMRPRRPLFFTCGGLDWQRKKWAGLGAFAIVQGERLSAALADRVITVSQALQQYYQERYNVQALCIVNGVDIVPPVALEKIPGLALTPRGYFLFVGRLVPEKRIEDLIAAIKLTDIDVKLVVAGGTAGASEYEQRLRRMAESDPRVVLAGYQYGDELAALLSNALAYVTASELEGLPLALLEGMSYGLPCLASDIPPHREVLAPTGAELFPVHDVQALAQGMRRLASLDQTQLISRGEVCRERVRASYSWDQAAHQLAQAYEQSLGRAL